MTGRYPWGTCRGETLQPGDAGCEVQTRGGSGVLEFMLSGGGEQMMGVTPASFDASKPVASGPSLVIDERESSNDGYVRIRNFGAESGKVLAIELASGDLGWAGSGDGCTGTTLAPGSDSCLLRVTGSNGTLRFFMDDGMPQEVRLDVSALPLAAVYVAPTPVPTPTPVATPTPMPTGTPTPVPTPSASEPARVALATTSIDRSNPLVTFWPITFTNEGGTDATITGVTMVGDLHVPTGGDVCTGRTLGYSKGLTPHFPAMATCFMDIAGHNGLVRFSLDNGTKQDVPVDLDLLSGWLTQADDDVGPTIYAPDAALPSSMVQLLYHSRTDIGTISDKLGVGKVQLLLHPLDGQNGGNDYLVNSIDYGCAIDWPPPRELPSQCQTKLYLNWFWFTGYFCPLCGPVAHPYADGAYRIIWKASNSRGIWTKLELPSIYLLDTTPPIVHPSGRLYESRYKNQMTGGDLRIDADDVAQDLATPSGVKSIELKWDATSDLRTRQDCPSIPCVPSYYTQTFSLDPVGPSWPNGTHTIITTAKDAAGNPATEPWSVSFWRTSWLYGSAPGSDDRTINTQAEIDAARIALGANGYNNATNTTWTGITPEERPLIYPISWSLGGADHQINTSYEISAARNALGSSGYANTTVLAGISPQDRPVIYPTSWSVGSLETNDHTINTPSEVATTRTALGDGGYGNAAVLAEISPQDRPALLPTSWTYGGDDHVIDTDSEISALEHDISPSSTWVTMWNGLSSEDQETLTGGFAADSGYVALGKVATGDNLSDGFAILTDDGPMTVTPSAGAPNSVTQTGYTTIRTTAANASNHWIVQLPESVTARGDSGTVYFDDSDGVSIASVNASSPSTSLSYTQVDSTSVQIDASGSGGPVWGMAAVATIAAQFTCTGTISNLTSGYNLHPSGLEACSGNVGGGKVTLTLETRKHFLFVGYWGTYDRKSVSRHGPGSIVVDFISPCITGNNRQYRAVLRGVAWAPGFLNNILHRASSESVSNVVKIGAC